MRKRTFIWILSLVLLLESCCRDKVTGDSYFCFGEISQADEVAMGEQYAPSFIAGSGGIYPDPELEGYLRTIVIDKMARKSHRPNLPWQFHVLNSSQINAFALPGGQVFVTRGLLVGLESEAQFAHLMGHEIGHVNHQHSIRGRSRGALFGLLLGALTIAEDRIFDPDEPPLIAGTVGAVGQLTLLKFSRDQELESDRRGVDYSVMAGYDPREGRKTFDLFLRMKEESGQREGLITGLFSTHPLDSRRIQEIDRYIRTEHPDLPDGLLVAGAGWEKTIARLKDAQKVYEKHDRALALVREVAKQGNPGRLDEAERLLRQCVRKLPGHASFHLGLGLVAVEKEEYPGAEKALNDACRLDPGLFGAFLLRGVVFRQTSRADLAIRDLERAHELHPMHPAPCYLLGDLHEKKGEVRRAHAWFKKSLELSPRDTEIRRKSRARLEGLERGGIV